MGYRMEQHMTQILDGLFLGDFQVGLIWVEVSVKKNP